MDSSNQHAIRSEHVYSAETFRTPSGGRPDVAVHIAANSIRSTRSHVDKHAAVLQAHTILHVVDANGPGIARMFRLPGVHDVEFLVIRREADAVRLIHIVDHNG